jgi:hypothetical protein
MFLTSETYKVAKTLAAKWAKTYFGSANAVKTYLEKTTGLGELVEVTA